MEAIDQVVHAAFPDLAAALRRGCPEIVRKWDVAVRAVLPQMDRLTLEEMRDGFPKILEAVAVALSSADPGAIAPLLSQAPIHGTSRFFQQYGVREISQECRLLRAAIVIEVDAQLQRTMTAVEAAALHATLDVMLLEAVLSLVREKEARLREATERELKYLAFLSHDMGNNLNAVKLALHIVREQVSGTSRGHDARENIAMAERAIDETMAGMRQLLQHERLRKGGATLHLEEVNLQTLLQDLRREFEQRAVAKGLRLELEIEPGAMARTDGKLVSMVLRNLIGNAIKFSDHGTIHLRSRRSEGQWALSVSDQGPGIESGQLNLIFGAFHRGEGLQDGVGLGLAIASQAASLLQGRLTVESTRGQGSVFTLWLQGSE